MAHRHRVSPFTGAPSGFAEALCRGFGQGDVHGDIAHRNLSSVTETATEIIQASRKMDKLPTQINWGRPALPEDIVPTGVFLVAEDSDYITGQIIPIEGGMILV